MLEHGANLTMSQRAQTLPMRPRLRGTHAFGPAHISTASAQIAVITAGAASHGNEAGCLSHQKMRPSSRRPPAASNPVDLITVVAIRHAGVSRKRVTGTGTLLDSHLLRQEIAHALGVAPGAIEGQVPGEHGDSEVAATSCSTRR